MSETTLKAVFRRDLNTKRYQSAGHNFSAQKAEERAAHLQDEGFDAAIVPQVLRHKGRGFKNCEPCKTAADHLSAPPDAVTESGPEEMAAENT